MYIRILTFSLFLAILCSCSNTSHNTKLLRIEEMTSKAPQKALDSLNAITYNQLSNADKHYFDFLTVKTKDKAFISHSSDSLILKVIEYERTHPENKRYAEALYYGGRVYQDLGDFPNALDYYHDALDNISNNEKDDILKGCILSQIGGILNSLRLFKRAIPYIEEAIALDSIRKDSINLVYDIELLGAIQLHAKKYNHAERIINKAKKIAQAISPVDTASCNTYLAAIKYYKGDIDAALRFIRISLPNIDSISRNVALSYACDIYRNATIPDTALLYAHELIRSKNSLNRKTGYKTILSKELQGYTPADSIISYATDYRDLIESQLNQNGNQAAMIQDSFYNYNQIQKHKEKADAKYERLLNWFYGILIITLLLIISVLWLKFKNKSRLLQLHEAIDNLNTLSNALKKSETKSQDHTINSPKNKSETGPYLTEGDTSQDVESLRIRLRDGILSLSNNAQTSIISPKILESEAYRRVLQHVKDNIPIQEKDPLWMELENIVTQSSPDFKYRLNLLTSGKMKISDFHLALLIKSGFSPTQMSTLVGRAKATIAYRRKILGLKIFDKETDLSLIDDIIRLL